MRRVSVWTDGSCLKQHGPSGWAALLRSSRDEKLITGGCPVATNNYAEIMAVIVALRFLRKPSVITITSDSQYVVNCASSWALSARQRGWQTAAGKAFANVELWEELLALADPHHVTYQWVRGHNGHTENELVDREARFAASRYKGIK